MAIAVDWQHMFVQFGLATCKSCHVVSTSLTPLTTVIGTISAMEMLVMFGDGIIQLLGQSQCLVGSNCWIKEFASSGGNCKLF